MTESKRGATTKAFLTYLKENGAQTVKQLSEQPFWGGVRSRVGELVKQKRIERVEVFVDGEIKKHQKAIVTAYKYIEGASIEPISPHHNSTSESYNERLRRERNEKGIIKAIDFLKRNGYEVINPTKNETS